MAGLALIIVALALVLGGDGGPFVEVLWWAAVFLAAASAIRIVTADQRERLRSEDPFDALGAIPDLIQRRRTQRPKAEVQAEWSSSD